jgi:hypothetical protein
MDKQEVVPLNVHPLHLKGKKLSVADIEIEQSPGDSRNLALMNFKSYIPILSLSTLNDIKSQNIIRSPLWEPQISYCNPYFYPKDKAAGSPKHWYLPIRPYSAASKEVVILTVVLCIRNTDQL